MRIGVIGLGPMGQAMAALLLAKGHQLILWNRTAHKAEALVRQGALLAQSPAEAARAEIVISSLADDQAVESVVFGEQGLNQGLIQGLEQGAVHVSTSTISHGLSERLAAAHRKRGQHYLSAPVLGRPPAAADGKLFVMVAGPAAVIGQARPVLEQLGQRVFVVGEHPAQANILKLCCNFLIFSTIEQLAEVFALTEKTGLDRATVFDVLTNSLFTAPVHKNYGKLIRDRAYDPPGAKVGLGAKDTRLMLQAGEALQVPLPYAALVWDRFLSAKARGEGDLDFTVIARQAAEAAGLKEEASPA